MSIAEKLTTIAENTLKVFKAPIDYTISLCDDYINYGAPQKINTAEKYTALNNKIDELNTLAYEVGYSNGELKGSSEGFDAGKQSENDGWWNALLADNRTVYDYCFYGFDFSLISRGFNPPKTIKPTYATQTFNHAKGVTKIKKEHFDFSVCQSMNYMFANCPDLVEIEELPIRCASNYVVASSANLETIGKIIIEDGTRFSEDAPPFASCTSLKNIAFEGGKIEKSLRLEWSKLLTKASIINTVNALSDTITGKTLTLSTTAVTNAFGSTSSQEWVNLIATKQNWTITLA